MQLESLRSVGPEFLDGETCEHSRREASGASIASSGAFHAKTSVTQTSFLELDSLETRAACGESSCVSSPNFDHLPSSSKTPGSSGESGCQQCGGNCGSADTGACPWASTPLYLGRSIDAGERSWLPTPTATANQLSPSMSKWPSCRNLQAFVGRIGGVPHPELWEWLMGLPIGWTALGVPATPFALSSPSGLATG